MQIRGALAVAMITVPALAGFADAYATRTAARKAMDAVSRRVVYLEAEVATVTEVMDSQARELATAAAALNALATEAPDDPGGAARAEKLQAAVPLSEAITLKGTVSQDRPDMKAAGAHDFSYWVEASPARLAEIKQVTWDLNHATFDDPVFEQSDRTGGFRSGYTGWGCVTDLKVALKTETGSVHLRLDLCDAVGWKKH